MTLTVRQSPELQIHLATFEVDGTTVADSLFEGGRLSYPARRELENALSMIEPYTLELEARVIEGFSRPVEDAIRHLAKWVHEISSATGGLDLTLELLWSAHEAWESNGISPDRLVAALVGIHALTNIPADLPQDVELNRAALAVVQALQAEGFPPSSDALEELFDGAPPASVGLCLIDIDW